MREIILQNGPACETIKADSPSLIRYPPMSEPRTNQTSQVATAILAIVVLLGAMVLGVGGLTWMRVRAARAAAEDAMRMAEQARFEAEAQQQRAAAAEAALDAAKARVEKPVPAEKADEPEPAEQ
jgi:uncharacterized protein HemX